MSSTTDDKTATKTELENALDVDLSDGENGPLNDFLESVQTQCDHIEMQGENITQLIVNLATTHKIDTDAANQTQDMIIELLGDFVEEYDEVTIKEVAIALWLELDRVGNMFSSDGDDIEERESSGTEDSGHETEVNTDGTDVSTPTNPIKGSDKGEDEETDSRNLGVNGMFQ